MGTQIITRTADSGTKSDDDRVNTCSRRDFPELRLSVEVKEYTLTASSPVPSRRVGSFPRFRAVILR